MNVLFAASEAFPFCKTGGLADVAGSLPIALAEGGDNVSVILPLIKEAVGPCIASAHGARTMANHTTCKLLDFTRNIVS